MKLFSVKELKQKDPTEEKIRESRFLDNLIKKQREDWNELKDKIDPERERIEKDFLNFNQSTQQKKGFLLKEVQELEDRKAKALEPLDQKWYELEIKDNNLKEWESLLKTKDLELSKERQELIDKGFFIEDKQEELAEREVKIAKDETKSFSQQESIQIQLKDLNQKWLDYHTKIKKLLTKEKQTQEILESKALLEKKAVELATKEKDLDEREGMVGLMELNLDYKTERLKLGEKNIEKQGVWVRNKVMNLRAREQQLIQRQIEHKRKGQKQ